MAANKRGPQIFITYIFPLITKLCNIHIIHSIVLILVTRIVVCLELAGKTVTINISPFQFTPRNNYF